MLPPLIECPADLDYILGDHAGEVGFPYFDVTSDSLCTYSQIQYETQVTDDPGFITFDDEKISWESDDGSLAGEYLISVTGYVDLDGKTVESTCAFTLNVQQAFCFTEGPQLVTSQIADVTYSVGTGSYQYNLVLSDDVQNQCLKEWTYSLFLADGSEREFGA